MHCWAELQYMDGALEWMSHVRIRRTHADLLAGRKESD